MWQRAAYYRRGTIFIRLLALARAWPPACGRCAGRGFHELVLRLMARGRVGDAAHQRVAVVEHLARLVAEDAGARRDTCRRLSAKLGVGDLRTRHLRAVTAAVGD